ncbi:hypothetical protein THAOC_05940 [Thalassiosira oceanica]|uniref:Uncharacterized protein n=1 Tax=Thalassiosira oceanica TaxID=159749 RepID=K0TM99_THAOC|nr:hypothetical protein THAOC_05940 [Thalassiosira oceanica]|eukprot:EJK72522.1 hypothetical protein THAOC_05940 [Thalassiosira oceanica]
MVPHIEPTATSTSNAPHCYRADILLVKQPGAPQIQQVFGAMDPLLVYRHGPSHLCAFSTPRGSGKTTWEPTATSTSNAPHCYRAEILLVKQPGTPQIQQVFGAMDPLLAYRLTGPHCHNWLNADEQGVDARRHVAFRSGSPKNLRAPRASCGHTVLSHARFQTAPTSLLMLQTCGGGLRLGRVKIMNSRSGTAACIGRAGLL